MGSSQERVQAGGEQREQEGAATDGPAWTPWLRTPGAVQVCEPEEQKPGGPVPTHAGQRGSPTSWDQHFCLRKLSRPFFSNDARWSRACSRDPEGKRVCRPLTQAGKPVCLGERKNSPGAWDGATGGTDLTATRTPPRPPSPLLSAYGFVGFIHFPRLPFQRNSQWRPNRACGEAVSVTLITLSKQHLDGGRTWATCLPQIGPLRSGGRVCSKPHSSSWNHAAGLASGRFLGREGRVQGRRRTGGHYVSGPGRTHTSLPGHGLPGEPTEQ